MVDTVEVIHNEADNRFEATVEGHLSIAAYELSDKTITFTHTEVPEELGGRGIAKVLAEQALAYARNNDLAVVPECPFFSTFIKRHPEYQPLLKS